MKKSNVCVLLFVGNSLYDSWEIVNFKWAIFRETADFLSSEKDANDCNYML